MLSNCVGFRPSVVVMLQPGRHINSDRKMKLLPGELVHLGDQVILDNVESVLGGEQLVVLRYQVLHLLAHAWSVKELNLAL